MQMNKISEANRLWIDANYHLGIKIISETLGIGKGTAQRYVKDARQRLETEEQRLNRISSYMAKATAKNIESINALRLKSQELAQDIFRKNIDDNRFHIGLALYWAEGSKSVLEFTNGDPSMIRGFSRWAKEYLPVKHLNFSIQIPDDVTVEDCKEFWAKQVDLSQFKLFRIYQSNRRLRIKTGVIKITICLTIRGAKELMKTLLQLEREYFDMGQ